jgi:hypothetical protein
MSTNSQVLNEHRKAAPVLCSARILDWAVLLRFICSLSTKIFGCSLLATFFLCSVSSSFPFLSLVLFLYPFVICRQPRAQRPHRSGVRQCSGMQFVHLYQLRGDHVQLLMDRNGWSDTERSSELWRDERNAPEKRREIALYKCGDGVWGLATETETWFGLNTFRFSACCSSICAQA